MARFMFSAALTNEKRTNKSTQMKRYLYNLLMVLSFILLLHRTQAQESWSLERCISYALEHNITIKQQQLQTLYNQNNLHQAKAAVLPSISASASYGFNFGNSVDPYTNDFIENNVQSSNLSLGGSLNLFRGLQKYNTIQQRDFEYKASVQDAEKMRNDVSLLVATAYLQILYSEELLEIAKKQLQVTQMQIERTKKLVEAGSLARGNLLEIEAQAASEELQVINSQNQLDINYLNLSQLIELESQENFKIVRPVFDEIDLFDQTLTPAMVYLEAQGLPQIKSAEFKLRASEEQLDFAYGSRSPSLSVYGGVGTGYSDARLKYAAMGDSYPVEMGYFKMNDIRYSVFRDMENMSATKYPIVDQYTDNISYSLSFNLSIPIFTNFQIKYGISNARINVESSKYTVDQTKNQLYKDIQQAFSDVRAAYARYNGGRKALEARQESFKYTEQKYNVGLVNSVDYNTEKNLLAKTESDMLQAKYGYIFSKNVLNFYRGLPIVLK